MKKERFFWGILFVLIGIVLVISKLGYFPNVNAFSLLLTVLLIVIIIKSLIHLNFAGILFPIAFICIIYDKQLGITNITPWTVLLAALFGSIGLSLIFHKRIEWCNTKYNWHNCKSKGNHIKSINIESNYDNNFEKSDVKDENYVKVESSFSETIKYINTNNFEQADLNCSFGAMKVYFDNAIMKDNNAIVRINASFSGIELYIPKSWKVDNKTNVFLGGIEEKNESSQVIENTLTLVGDINFSGVEIIYI